MAGYDHRPVHSVLTISGDIPTIDVSQIAVQGSLAVTRAASLFSWEEVADVPYSPQEATRNRGTENKGVTVRISMLKELR